MKHITYSEKTTILKLAKEESDTLGVYLAELGIRFNDIPPLLIDIVKMLQADRDLDIELNC